MKDLKERTLRGGLAKVFNQGIIFALRLGSTAILARILSPQDFGLVAMVTVVTGVYGLFTTAGLSSATVQRATVTDEQVSTLFWINIMVGAILTLLCLVTAPFIVAFFHEPRLFRVTIALAAGFLINAAGVQHSALLQRQMRFVALTVIDTASSVASIALGLGLAVFGAGYWALVAMTIANPLVNTVCVWFTAKWIPGAPRRGTGIRSMLRFGGTLTLNGLVVYVGYNLEKVLLGRFWGADALGLYGRAYSIVNMPTENLNSAVGGITFSALSRLQHDPGRFKSYFLKGYTLVLSMTIPITAFSAIFADEIILVLLGPKWQEAAVIFRLLTPTVFIFGLINPLGWMLVSSGLQVRSLKIALALAPVVIVSVATGIPYGPRGVAFCYSAGLTLWLLPHVAWCIHGTMFSMMDLVHSLRRPFLSSLSASAVAYLFQFYCGHLLPAFTMLVLGGGILFGVYLWMLLFVMGQKQFYLDIVKGFKTPPPSEIRETDAVPADA